MRWNFVFERENNKGFGSALAVPSISARLGRLVDMEERMIRK